MTTAIIALCSQQPILLWQYEAEYRVRCTRMVHSWSSPFFLVYINDLKRNFISSVKFFKRFSFIELSMIPTNQHRILTMTLIMEMEKSMDKSLYPDPIRQTWKYYCHLRWDRPFNGICQLEE